MQTSFTSEQIKKMICEKLTDNLAVSPENAPDELFYKASALVVRDILVNKRRQFKAATNAAARKQTYYLCIEFLMGRSLKNSIYNLELVEPFTEALAQMGVKLENLYDYEPDAGLGNGGLGRLAACFLDALATTEHPAMGYSILYEFGIFKQKIVDGWQTEQPDYWLPGGSVWLVPRPELAVSVHFGGNVEEYWDQNYHFISHKKLYQRQCRSLRHVCNRL